MKKILVASALLVLVFFSCSTAGGAYQYIPQKSIGYFKLNAASLTASSFYKTIMAKAGEQGSSQDELNKMMEDMTGATIADLKSAEFFILDISEEDGPLGGAVINFSKIDNEKLTASFKDKFKAQVVEYQGAQYLFSSQDKVCLYINGNTLVACNNPKVMEAVLDAKKTGNTLQKNQALLSLLSANSSSTFYGAILIPDAMKTQMGREGGMGTADNASGFIQVSEDLNSKFTVKFQDSESPQRFAEMANESLDMITDQDTLKEAFDKAIKISVSADQLLLLVEVSITKEIVNYLEQLQQMGSAL